MTRLTNRWIADTPITALAWTSDRRVRELNCELTEVSEQMGRRGANILALLAIWWFLSCVLWFGLSYLCAHASWELFWQICKYGGRIIGVTVAFIGALCFLGLIVTQGRLFRELDD